MSKYPLDVRRLIQHIPRLGNREIKALDPLSEKMATYYLSHIPSAGWTFIIVKRDENADPAPSY